MSQRVESEKYSTDNRVPRDYREPKETKTFSKTSEFFVWALTVAAVLIAVLVIDGFGPDRGWTLVTALSIGYMISRGLAKSGARKSDYEGYDLARR